MSTHYIPAAAGLPLPSAAPGFAPSSTAAPSVLEAHFVPRWPNNPYQAELARHLSSHGVAVSTESRLKDILHAARRKARAPAIVHLHAVPPFSWHPRRLLRLAAFVFRLFQLRRAGTRLVWTVHNACDHESAHPRIDRLLARAAYHAVDAAILHSPGARSLAEQQWRTRRTRNVFLIHHGHFIDSYRAPLSRAQARTQLGIPLEALVFLFLGNVRPYKGVPQLVREFKAVASPHLRLVIAGDVHSPELEADIVREIDDSPLVDFRPGFVPDADVSTYLSACNAVVFPYTKALTSGALILAMSFGRACIAPAIGALADTLSPRGGYLFDPADSAALRNALSAAIRSATKLDAMGAHNHRRARQWGWDEAARQTAHVYQTVLQPGD
jgi:Glycosyltransferase